MAEETMRPETASPEEIKALFELQRSARWRIAATSADERIAMLHRLDDAIRTHRQAIYEALRGDFHKHPHETDFTEIRTTTEELHYIAKRLRRWMKPRRVGTPLELFGGTSRIRYEPKGLALILSPWNYPFQLAMAPFVAAIAAGNCVILRPSDKTPRTAKVIDDVITTAFPREHAAVLRGGHQVADRLLELPFDHIFFTGSPNIGRKVMAAAAQHLASVTLELGGKSPVVVDETADLVATAQRLCFGKFINAGQTCVAPDYVLVNEQVADSLAAALKATIEQFYGLTDEARLDNDSFASLVDERSLARIEAATNETIAQGARVVIGGRRHPTQPRRYAPTVLADVPNDSAIMREEIFGPVLPLLKVRSLDEAIAIIRGRPKPLALYVFSRDEAKIERVLSETTAGGSTVNNTLLHLANPNLPFGGIGESGLGNYHGRFGFETFSHARAVYKQVAPSAVKLICPPYNSRRARLLQLVGLMDKSLK